MFPHSHWLVSLCFLREGFPRHTHALFSSFLYSLNQGDCMIVSPSFLLIKMDVILVYCNSLMVLCAYWIPSTHPPIHPFTDSFTSKQLLNMYHSTGWAQWEREANADPWSFLLAVSQRTMRVRYMPSRKQVGCDIILVTRRKWSLEKGVLAVEIRKGLVEEEMSELALKTTRI